MSPTKGCISLQCAGYGKGVPPCQHILSLPWQWLPPEYRVGKGQASPTTSAWGIMPSPGFRSFRPLCRRVTRRGRGGVVRFLAQWRGCDSCPGPLPVGGRQLCPLKPEPWHPAAELGKETPLGPQPCTVGWSVLGGHCGSSWGIMGAGGKCGHWWHLCSGSTGDGAMLGVPTPSPARPAPSA